MLKNVIVVSDYAYVDGGAAKVAIQTALALSKQTDLTIYYFAGCGEACDALVNSSVKTICLHMPDLLGNPSKLDAMIKGIYNKKAGRELEKLLCTLDISETVVHVHTWTKVLSSSVFATCKKLKVKTFLTVHDYFLTCPNGACYDYVKRRICTIKPMSLKCMACNCDSRNYIQKLWRCLRQFRQNRVIYSFRELNYILISNFQKMQLANRIPCINQSVIIKNIIDMGESDYITDVEKQDKYLFLGRVAKEKGPDIFCEAIKKAEVNGIVIGEGPLKESLQNEYENIQFMGWKSKKEIDGVLKTVRALVFPSVWYEGSPLTVPEVQVHGIPCIVTKCNAAVDDIVDGENGFVTEPNAVDISKAIEKINDNDVVRSMSLKTVQYFDFSRISEEKYIEELVSVYIA